MTVRVAINGFGRIGRAAVRSAITSGSAIEIVAVNDVADAAVLAHLLEYDSVYGHIAVPVRRTEGGIRVGGREIAVLAETDPENLPWRDLGVDVVIESTGRFRTNDAAGAHLRAGARKVIVSAPVPDADVTLVLGVNDRAYDPDRHFVISNASCTTNCVAPVASVLHRAVGIRHGLMTTIHAYTADQRLLDMPHKDLRRARAAALNLIPTSTGAAKALGIVIPELAGKLHGYAVRVPLPTGSMVDLTVETERATSIEEVNAAFAEAAHGADLDGILRYSEAPLVSSDIVASPYSSVFDAPLTAVVDGTCVKVVAWYDNEWGYATRLVELAARVLAPLAVGLD
jgi:glyceraldehyde 3-phosphate dehydrogenase